YFLLHLCTYFSYTHAATPEIYRLSLHDALPIFETVWQWRRGFDVSDVERRFLAHAKPNGCDAEARFSRVAQRAGISWRGSRLSRSEEHTSELQSRGHLVCRLLLEKKNQRVAHR